MIMKVKNSFKRAFKRFIDGRQETINFKVADQLKHNYPPNTSLHAIVRDLKEKHNA